MAGKRQYLTTAQENLLERLRRLSSRREDGWVHVQDVGQSSGCAKLVGKGFAEAQERPDGTYYKPVAK
jgi:hypothetical protein